MNHFFKVILMALVTCGCCGTKPYKSSPIFNTLDTGFNRENFITTNSPNDRISFDARGTGEMTGSDYKWSDHRLLFSIAATNTDHLFEAYRDKVATELHSKSIDFWGGDIIHSANLRQFSYDYESGTFGGNITAYSIISTNGQIWIIDSIYEHQR